MTNNPVLTQQIIERDLEWAQAHRDLDLKLIEDILSEQYQQIQDNGSSIGKSELLESYGSGNRQWDIAESSGHQVQFSGDLAILIGQWRGKGINTGEEFNYSARFISIYRLENGSWKMIHDQSALID